VRATSHQWVGAGPAGSTRVRRILHRPRWAPPRLTRAEAQGLVRRHREGPDGRAVTVELTPAGHALVERTVEDLLRHEETLLTALDPDQRAQLTGLLRLLLADLTARAQDPGPAPEPGSPEEAVRSAGEVQAVGEDEERLGEG
jgi:hypothetical protein